jgi:hypothetical protein
MKILFGWFPVPRPVPQWKKVKFPVPARGKEVWYKVMRMLWRNNEVGRAREEENGMKGGIEGGRV